ncbi:hypothetical protein [Romboutsia sp.]|uniref:hypothetical protein n=1 Tax=Romboutsia sp. TaxID=1965302 RepID=UPI003F2D4A10
MKLFNRANTGLACNLPFESEECTKFLNNSYKNTVAETIILKEELYENFKYYDEVIKEISKLEIEKKAIENSIKNEMKEYESAVCKERKITWKNISKTTVDTKRLKVDHPEIIEKYSKTSTSRVFRLR